MVHEIAYEGMQELVLTSSHRAMHWVLAYDTEYPKHYTILVAVVCFSLRTCEQLLST